MGKIFEKNGEKKGFLIIKNNMCSRGNKFPWTHGEMEHALSEALKDLKIV